MKKIHILSNRLPVTVNLDEKQIFKDSSGGLATGLRSFSSEYEGKWIGWPGIETDDVGTRKLKIDKYLKDKNCVPIYLNKQEVEDFYLGFSNKTLWPLFHYFPQYTVFDKQLWKTYKRVNKLYCDVALENISEDDYIWIHDYHLMLLPRLIRDRLPNAKIGFFLHIPFPSFEIIRSLPWRKELMSGLTGADLVGFHSYDYARHFISAMRRILGLNHHWNLIQTPNREIKTDVFPISIDYNKFYTAPKKTPVQNIIDKNDKFFKDRKIIISVDRLDYTKGIKNRLDAFDKFLKEYPEYIGKVILVLLVVPSRSNVDQYNILKEKLEQQIGRINGKYSKVDYAPIHYLYKSVSFDELSALYGRADIGLVTPLRDGMNLVAKEFVASKNNQKGVLILSETAGAAMELSEALIINPNNIDDIVNALKEALVMDESTQTKRIIKMQKRIRRYDIHRWAKDFFDSLVEHCNKRNILDENYLDSNLQQKIKTKYLKAKNRLILLDYDGSLVDFHVKPEEALPTKDVIDIVRMLASEPNNDVVIVSGRDRFFLDNAFPLKNISMVAEHGVWTKKSGKDWEAHLDTENKWMKKIKDIMNFHVDRTPGSFVEEKEYALVWHYRKVELDLAVVRARELHDILISLTENLSVGVHQGKKTIEVKNSLINKGLAIEKWLESKKWDFVLAIGDDWTDEDMFERIASDGYSIKVGPGITKAKYNLKNVNGVHSLLNKLTGKTNAKY